MSWAEKYPEQRLVAYDGDWANLYLEYEAHLLACLGHRWEFEHVGSTSVPGLLAKPVIDIAMRMPAEVGLSEATQRLLQADWSAPVPVGDHWTTVVATGGVRSAIGHVFTAGQWPEAHLRLFADWLRRHQADRDRYASLKRDLVERGVWSAEYTESKSAFVLGVVNQARAERGLCATNGPL